VLKTSKNFFKNYGIDLEVTDEAILKIADEAALHSRIGARALKALWGQIIKPFEFDPFSKEELQKEGDALRLVIDERMVTEALRSPLERRP
jgi:ATP-dependent protease Clp ATPase subunit